MSELHRVALPTNQDLGHAEVDLLDDPANYPVAAPQLPGRSDDELRHAAEKEDDWALYKTHGIDQSPLPYRALWHRFKDGYKGEGVDEPSGFIKTVLQMQRRVPTAREYAAALAKKGLIRADEVAGLPDQFRDELLKTEEGEDQARAHFKVWYLANATIPGLRTSDLASRYASDRMRSAARDEKARRRAVESLSQARGIEGSDLRVIMDGLSTYRRTDHLRRLGMPNDLIAQLDNAPKPDPLEPRFVSAVSIANSTLSSPSLDTQLAYRRFFGMQNLADMAAANAAVEKPFDDESLAFSAGAISAHLAGTHLVHSSLAPDKPFRSLFYDEELISELGIPEQMAALGALASFMMRESALNGPQDHIYTRSDFLGHHVVSMVTADYRIWLDQRMEQERLTNQ